MQVCIQLLKFQAAQQSITDKERCELAEFEAAKRRKLLKLAGNFEFTIKPKADGNKTIKSNVQTSPQPII